MKTSPGFLTLSLLLIALPVAAQVSLPESRQQLLEKAEALVVKEISMEERARFAAVADPFHSAVSESEKIDENAVAMELEVELSDEIILAEIIALISPRGILKRGSETLLVIEENRIPVGQYLRARYKGEDYRIQLVKADAHRFVLRLNDETITKRIR